MPVVLGGNYVTVEHVGDKRSENKEEYAINNFHSPWHWRLHKDSSALVRKFFAESMESIGTSTNLVSRFILVTLALKSSTASV